MKEKNEIRDVEKVYDYWLTSSDNDFTVMLTLYRSNSYSWALFLGHIVIEKLIKAWIVKNTGNHAPFIHDLRLLARKGSMEISDEMALQFDVITGFNINARYDSFKSDFQKKCTPEFSAEWIEKISIIRLWIKEKL